MEAQALLTLGVAECAGGPVWIDDKEVLFSFGNGVVAQHVDKGSQDAIPYDHAPARSLCSDVRNNNMQRSAMYSGRPTWIWALPPLMPPSLPPARKSKSSHMLTLGWHQLFLSLLQRLSGHTVPLRHDRESHPSAPIINSQGTPGCASMQAIGAFRSPAALYLWCISRALSYPSVLAGSPAAAYVRFIPRILPRPCCPLQDPQQQHAPWVHLAFSQDGKHLASVGSYPEHVLEIWDLPEPPTPLKLGAKSDPPDPATVSAR
eukprot:1144966-Pelagomonas_calceolata.AAC.1